jgi:hypothetical protein
MLVRDWQAAVLSQPSFLMELNGAQVVIRAAPVQGFPMEFVFHSPAVGHATVCIVGGQAATSYFHLAGRPPAPLMECFFGSASLSE